MSQLSTRHASTRQTWPRLTGPGIGTGRETVAKSGGVLLPVVFMGLVFVYWFAVVGFLTYPNVFQFRKAEVRRWAWVPVPQCAPRLLAWKALIGKV